MPSKGCTHAEEWRIPSTSDPDACLFVRRRGKPGSVPAVLVHGFFQPGSAILDVPGYSLQQALADAGLRVYLFDLRGYGRSSRPAFMEVPPQHSRPALGCMADAVADLADVVAFVRKQEDVACVDLIGYSWGTARSANFTLAAPGCVRRLALYAPVWRPAAGAAANVGDGKVPPNLDPRLGGCTVVLRGALRRGWDWEIGAADAAEYRDPAALACAESSLMDSDQGRGSSAEGFRAPMGPKVDALQVLRGGQLFDAPRLRHDLLLVRGAQDKLSSEGDAAALFESLGSPHKRLVTIDRGTHLLHLEHARWRLVDELAGFLAGDRV